MGIKEENRIVACCKVNGTVSKSRMARTKVNVSIAIIPGKDSFREV